MSLGGGRETKESVIDLGVGIYLNKKIGESVKNGETIATIYGNDNDKINSALSLLQSAYVIEDANISVPLSKMIKKVIV